MQQTKFSICIPTYNRASFLKEAVFSVLSQLNGDYKDTVEIVISDNASTDGTADLVKEFQRNAPISIVYNRNNLNLGCDKNFLRVVELAKGNYCWILGDDDQVFPEAINIILAQIDKNEEVDLFLANREDRDFTFKHSFRFVSALKIDSERVFDFNQIDIANYLNQVRKLTGIFSYLSSLIFKREKWLSVPNQEKFIGSRYIHVYMFMSLVWGRNKGRLKYLPDKIVRTRWGNDRSFDDIDLSERIKVDFEAFHSIATAVLSKNRLVWQIDGLVLKHDVFSWIVRARIVQGPTFFRKTFPFLLKHYWSLPLFWLKVVPMVLTPAFVLKVMRWVYRRIIKREPLGIKDI